MTLISEFKKPFNIVTLGLTVFSIALSVFFYFKSVKEKSLSYLLTEPASLIYDSQNSVPTIKIYERDSIPINGSIFLLTGKVWNSGDFPIVKTDLRLPISLSLKKNNRILDYKLIKIRDSSIANFSLLKQTSNSLSVDWNYFDPGFGFSFQIIYVGEFNSGFELKGKILGISHFNKVAKKENEISSLLVILVICFSFLVSIFQLYTLYKERNEEIKLIRWLNILTALIPLIGSIYLTWHFFFKYTIPPF